MWKVKILANSYYYVAWESATGKWYFHTSLMKFQNVVESESATTTFQIGLFNLKWLLLKKGTFLLSGKKFPIGLPPTLAAVSMHVCTAVAKKIEKVAE